MFMHTITPHKIKVALQYASLNPKVPGSLDHMSLGISISKGIKPRLWRHFWIVEASNPWVYLVPRKK